VESARQIAEEAAERARKRQRPDIPQWAAREKDRFFPHVALELYGLRALIGETKEDDVGRALRAGLSSILVKFMRGSEEAEARRIGRGVPRTSLPAVPKNWRAAWRPWNGEHRRERSRHGFA